MNENQSVDYFVGEFEKQFFEMFNKIVSFSRAMPTYFRGHGQADWNLWPSIARPENEKFKRNEIRVFYDYKNKGHIKLGKLSNWEVLFSMQHHGLPTRLLDWSDSLNVALFFAVKHFEAIESSDKKNPCVWILNVPRFSFQTWGRTDLVIPSDDHLFSYDYFLNEKGKSENDFLADVIALYPPKSDERLIAQGGMFTFHKKTEPLQNLFREFLFKIEIDKSQIPLVKKYLYFSGVKESHLFPDLDGLAREIVYEVKNSSSKPTTITPI